ncbi:unnamed protein product [Pleuronectes platessa]|uniref:Uncharacterized protein n=1 Tax=Pleuronectes platessa TaxID=8262 RepID=A0A9N7V373_PLEPL|nr:unnamed protein product [Pleuronectes platessa]
MAPSGQAVHGFSFPSAMQQAPLRSLSYVSTHPTHCAPSVSDLAFQNFCLGSKYISTLNLPSPHLPPIPTTPRRERSAEDTAEQQLARRAFPDSSNSEPRPHASTPPASPPPPPPVAPKARWETEKENEIQALTEKVEQLENQVKDKDVVITKEVEKGRARLRAYVDCLAELTDCQAKAKIWKQVCTSEQ